MHNPLHNETIEQSLAPQSIQATALNSGNIDMQGHETLAVAVMIGNIADTLSASVKVDIKIEHADDNGTGAPGTYNACVDDDVLNYSGLSSGVFLTLDSNAKKSKRYVIGYRGGKRFVKVTATPASLATGGPVAMLALKGQPAQKPAIN